MKLHIVPARQGIQWVKLGMQTFFRQPMALAGLFFLFLAAMSLFSLVPLVGNLVAMTLLPGATLGLMAATREAGDGKFPMPTILLSAFRAGRQEMRAMLLLGALYAVGLMIVLAASAAIVRSVYRSCAAPSAIRWLRKSMLPMRKSASQCGN